MSDYDHTLAANVENLFLNSGGFATFAIGNALNNIAGFDSMSGGLGNDSYYVDSAGIVCGQI